jgi:hypothetical protein
MTIATDPKSDSLSEEQDEFEKHFEEFASGKTPDPQPEEEPEPAPSEGNGPEEDAPAPEAEGEEPETPATEEQKPTEQATSDDAKPEGAEPAPKGEEAPDPWANASPELKALYEQVQKERDEARHKAQSDANRVAALSRKLREFSVPSSSSAPAPEEQPTEAQKALDAKIKQLREDYGEIAEPLIEMIEVQRKELAHVKANLTGLTEHQQAQVVAAETAALEERHPDWRDIAQSPDFEGWLTVQPENIQRLAASWDARETSVVLTLFKAERGGTEGPKEEAPAQAAPTPKPDAATGARRSQQLDGGRDVRSRPAPVASGPPEDFEAAFKYFEEQRRLKAQAGQRR